MSLQQASIDPRRGGGVAAGAGLFPSGSWLSDRAFRDLAVLLFCCAGAVALLTFRDYGITTDEQVQNVYGKMLLSYYGSGFRDLAALHYKDLFYYGGLFDLLAALLNQVSPFGEYETRHLLGGLVGVLGLIGTWQTARRLGGERAGFLAALLLVLTPSYYGGSFNNPKDVPFAVGMIWTLHGLCRLLADLPRPSLAKVGWFGICFGLTLGVRVGAGLMAVYLAATLVGYLIWRGVELRSLRPLPGEAGRLCLAFLPAVPIAYALMAVFWPWSYQSPGNPLAAAEHFVHYDIPLSTLLDGRWLDARHLPAFYLPLYLAVKLPEIALLGLVAAACLGAKWAVALVQPGAARRRAERGRLLEYFAVILAAVLPIGLFIVLRPTAYNCIRHFLFILPPLAVIAGLALDGAWTMAGGNSPLRTRAIGLAVAGAALLQIWVMVRLHPDEYVYYNVLAGGVKGADGKYELDYWGNSLAEATRDLVQHIELEDGGVLPPGGYAVAVCGLPLAVAYHLPPAFRLVDDPRRADFLVAFTQAHCDRLATGREIIAVERFGAVLSVVKDLRPPAGSRP